MAAPLKLSFVHLHGPLFLAGTNLGEKLQTTVRNVKLEYHRDNQELHVTFNGKMAIVPVSNVVSMQLYDDSTDATNKAPVVPIGKVQAQVSTPQSHVFEQGKVLK
jgi:hypothetical protein